MKKGFTLVEMLIVVVIIGILATALIPRLVGAQSQARDVARKKHISDISNALEFMYNDKGEYPNFTNGLNGALCGNHTFPKQSLFSAISGYISSVPNDPQKNHKNYGRFAQAGEDPYCLGEYSYTVLSIKNTVDSIGISGTGNANLDRKNQNLKSFVVSANMENIKNANIVEPLAPSNINSENRLYGFPFPMPKKRFEEKICTNIKLIPNPNNTGVCGVMKYDGNFDHGACCETNDITRLLYSYFSRN